MLAKRTAVPRSSLRIRPRHAAGWMLVVAVFGAASPGRGQQAESDLGVYVTPQMALIHGWPGGGAQLELASGVPLRPAVDLLAGPGAALAGVHVLLGLPRSRHQTGKRVYGGLGLAYVAVPPGIVRLGTARLGIELPGEKAAALRLEGRVYVLDFGRLPGLGLVAGVRLP